KLEQCSRCGALIGTMQEIRRAMRSLQHPPDGLCPACRQLKLADEMQHTFGVRRAAAKKQPAD
ncbi:MAG: hypothetical protein GX637_01460, partial [Clostridiales bacterium]|nr:hypothetical protein [Clostridiales bacterium]